MHGREARREDAHRRPLAMRGELCAALRSTDRFHRKERERNGARNISSIIAFQDSWKEANFSAPHALELIAIAAR